MKPLASLATWVLAPRRSAFSALAPSLCRIRSAIFQWAADTRSAQQEKEHEEQRDTPPLSSLITIRLF